MRNTYEADIGRFTPVEGGAEYIDPKVHTRLSMSCTQHLFDESFSFVSFVSAFIFVFNV